MKPDKIGLTVLSAGGAQKIECAPGITVRETLEMISCPIREDYLITINGLKSDLNSPLKDNDILIVIPSLKAAGTLRRNGKVWRYYKYDKDTNFPSDFHLHNIQNGEILDMYTGYVFDPRTHQPLGALSKKAMRKLYTDLRKLKDVEISARCDDDPTKFQYLNRS